jgi:hypothetical protein
MVATCFDADIRGFKDLCKYFVWEFSGVDNPCKVVYHVMPIVFVSFVQTSLQLSTFVPHKQILAALLSKYI